MKLAVSNIAWSPKDRDVAYALLQARGVRGLEIAPALFLNESEDPFMPTEDEIVRSLSPVREVGLELISMQSLLFGVEGAALFEGEQEALRRFRAGLQRAIALAERLSVPNLVFGSPRQRNMPLNITYKIAEGIALDVFRDLGDVALAAGTRLGIEFNPAAYGTNFLNDASQALAFVEKANHPAVTLILDIGAMHMNGHFDQIEGVVARAAHRISHVHLSEPYLAPAPADPVQAARVLSAMTNEGYQGWYSIEMKTVPDGGLAALERSLDRLQLAVAAAGMQRDVAW